MKKTVFTFLLLPIFIKANAQYQHVPLQPGSFNADLVANGAGAASASSSGYLDSGQYNPPGPGEWVPVATGFNGANGSPVQSTLPDDGLINSNHSSGLSFQMAGYNGNNARLLSGTDTGSIYFTTTLRAHKLHLLVASGHGSGAVTATVRFTDQSIESFAVSIPQMLLSGAQPVAPAGGKAIGVRMVNRANDQFDGASDPFYLYEIILDVHTFNYGKEITGIHFAKTEAGKSRIAIYAVSAQPIHGCVAPSAQPSGLTLTSGGSHISGSFTATAGNRYLVVRTPGSAPHNTPPANGVTYTPGTALGNGTVISASPATSYTDMGLSGTTTYTYTVYAYNDSLCYPTANNPMYRTSGPLTASATTLTCNSIIAAGAYTIGSGGTYSSLTSAISDIITKGIAGNIVLELLANYSTAGEIFPIVIPDITQNACTAPNSEITIRPAAGVTTTLAISASTATPTLDLNGAKRVTIDGRPGGTGTTIRLQIANTSNTGVAVRLFNDASDNTIRYCDLQGQNNATDITGPAGVVYFGAAHATTLKGNDRNTIAYSSIHSTGASTLPRYGIVSYGSFDSDPAYNDSGKITGCNIYDYFVNSGFSSGILLDRGNNAWIIEENSIYQTDSRPFLAGPVPAGGTLHAGIRVVPAPTIPLTTTGGGFLISRNIIGGRGPGASGDPYTMTGGHRSDFTGIELATGSGSVSSVQGNIIKNIAHTGSGYNAFWGIALSRGRVDAGTESGNIIGDSTGNGSVTLNVSGIPALNSNQGAYGIQIGGSLDTVRVENNIIGSITITPGTTNVYSFTGIGPAGANTTVYVRNNLIGSRSTSNSIQVSQTANNNQHRVIGVGISINTATYSVISDNYIANISNAHTGSTQENSVYGIRVASGESIITGNTIHDLQSTSTRTNQDVSPAISGIHIPAGATGINLTSTITDNTIHSLRLTSTSTTATIRATGIYVGGATAAGNTFRSATVTVSGNFIHSFDATASNPTITFAGIHANVFSTGAIANNFIRLGIRPDGTDITVPVTIAGIQAATATGNGFTPDLDILFNSIYIGGTGVNSTTAAQKTYSFWKTAANGNYTLLNNIFVNNRSNATGTAAHACLFIQDTTNVSIGYNIYQNKGDGGIFATCQNGSITVPSYIKGWISSDTSSIDENPQFRNPDGNAATADLHIKPFAVTPAESTGLPLSVITTDYDGEQRNALSPTDIGADAGNFRPLQAPVIYNSSPVCNGDTIVLINGGANSGSYQWTGPNSFSATGKEVRIPNATAAHSGTYYVTGKFGNFTTPVDSVIVEVVQSVTPAVTITPDQGTTVCPGSEVTFTAHVSGGGASPVFAWRKNTISVGGNSITYTDNSLANGDVIVCTVTGNATCATSSTATSAPLTISVSSNIVPEITLSADPGLNICPDIEVTFSAAALHGGAAPGYQWYKNGLPAGGLSAEYKDNTLADGDVIYCLLTSSLSCASPDTVRSATLTVNVNPLIPAVQVNGDTLSTGNHYETYQWYHNDAVISGATTDTYIADKAGNYKVTVTDSIGCTGTSTSHYTAPAFVGSSVSADGISVYPNPAPDVLHIKGLPGGAYVRICHIDGRLISVAYPASGMIDVHTLSEGLYMIYIADKTGKQIAVHKMIKSGK